MLQQGPATMPATRTCSSSGCEPQRRKVEKILEPIFVCLAFPILLWFTIGFLVAPVSSLMYLLSVSKPT